MAYPSGARLEGLGQTTSWWQIAGEVVTAVAKVAPSVVQAFAKPKAPAPYFAPIQLPVAPAPAAPAPAPAAAPAGLAAGMPTWGWAALGGGALLLVVLTMGMGGGRTATPVYVVDRGARRR